jgi:Ala-tRNA(Pro) deacylase
MRKGHQAAMPATREELLARLKSLGIEATTRDHPPVYTVEEARALRGEIPGGHCKNLFLKDDKGNLWLIVCLEEAEVDLKAAPAKIGSRRLSFGRAELLREVLGVEPGSVTPFGLINDTEQRVNVVLDAGMMAHELLNYHPLENTATTTVDQGSLRRFLDHLGREPLVVDFARLALCPLPAR